MAPTLIQRIPHLTDDDGTGRTGSVFNDSSLQNLYDNIDAEYAAPIEYGGVLTAPAQPRAVAYDSAPRGVLSGALTAVAFDSETVDVGGLHNVSFNNSRMTLPLSGGDSLSGGYLLIAKIQWQQSAGGSGRVVRFRRNGADYGTERIRVPTALTTEIVCLTQIVPDAVATDYFEVFVFQDSGGTLNIGNASREQANEFSIVKLW